jgi:hypothetical protein
VFIFTRQDLVNLILCGYKEREYTYRSLQDQYTLRIPWNYKFQGIYSESPILARKQSSLLAYPHQKAPQELFDFVRVARIGLASQPWEGRMLPLYHTRNINFFYEKDLSENQRNFSLGFVLPPNPLPLIDLLLLYLKLFLPL